MEEDPFPDLKIDPAEFLDIIEGREICPKCKRSRKIYCYSCYIRLQGTGDRIPTVKLPVKIDVIKHVQEVDGKCTSAQAAVIASDDVSVYEYPNIPDYPDKTKVLLIFPGKSSLTMEQYAQKFSRPESMSTPAHCNVNATEHLAKNCAKTEPDPPQLVVENQSALQNGLVNDQLDLTGKHNEEVSMSTESLDEAMSSAGVNQGKTIKPRVPGRHCDHPRSQYRKTFERVIFIDCTWFQVNKIYPDERLTGIQCIELKSQRTKFWRHQTKKPDTYLSTVEAMYYFMREYHDLYEPIPYNGQYDNLLFFFVYMYHKIRDRYKGSKVLKAYKNTCK